MEPPFENTSRPVGRPRTPETETITVRIEATERDKVLALVEHTGAASLSDLIRRALNHYANTALPPVAAAPESVTIEDRWNQFAREACKQEPDDMPDEVFAGFAEGVCSMCAIMVKIMTEANDGEEVNRRCCETLDSVIRLGDERHARRQARSN
jgi:hypothetical protein